MTVTMSKYINCTPHAISLNDGRKFQPSGQLARVGTVWGEIEGDFVSMDTTEVTGIPTAVEGVFIIVSAMVLGASDRKDLVAPATGHPLTIRNDKGHIVSVPCFISNK